MKTGWLLVFGAMALHLLVSIALLVNAKLNRLPPPSGVVTLAYGAGVAVSLLGAAIAIPARRAHRRKLREHECRLCLHCYYVLPSEPPTGVCPECGLKYDLPATVDAWHKGGHARRLKAGESR